MNTATNFWLNEGDAVFVFGSIQAVNGPEGFFILPRDVYNMEEIQTYTLVHRDGIVLQKKHLRDIATIKTGPEEAMSFAKNPHEVVQLYAKNREVPDYLALAGAAHAYYLRFPCDKAARAVVRYYMLCVKHMGFKWEMFREIFPVGDLEEDGEGADKTL